MKTLLTSFFILLISLGVSSQTIRMSTPEMGRNFSIQDQSQTVYPLLLEADQRFRTFDFEGTLFALENAVALDPYSPEALLLRARFKRMMGQNTEAEQDLALALRINPYVADLYGYRGNEGLLNVLAFRPEQATQNLSSYQKLTVYFEWLDRQALQNSSSNLELDYLEAAMADIESGNNQRALTTLNELIDIRPDAAIAYDLKGLVLQRQGNLHEAMDAFKTATKLQPDFAIAWYNLGQVEHQLQNFDAAKAHLDQAILLQTDLTKAYFERAQVYKAMGKPEAALSDYNTVIQQEGANYLEAYVNRGLTRKALGDFNGALADLERAIREFPENAELYKNRGNVYLLFGLHRNAIDDFTKAIQLNPSFAEAYYNRALAHLLNYDRVSACFDLEISAEMNYDRAAELRSYFCAN